MVRILLNTWRSLVSFKMAPSRRSAWPGVLGSWMAATSSRRAARKRRKRSSISGYFCKSFSVIMLYSSGVCSSRANTILLRREWRFLSLTHPWKEPAHGVAAVV